MSLRAPKRLAPPLLTLVVAAVGPSWAAGPAAAQEPPAEPGVVPATEPTDSEFLEPRTERLEIRLRLERSSHDNFDRLPEGQEGEDRTVDRGELGLSWSLFEGRPFKLFVEAMETQYEDRPSASTFAGGFRLDGKRHFVETRVEVSDNRVSTDLEDDPDPADAERFEAEYDVRVTRDWQVSSLVEVEQRSHDSGGSDSETANLAVALRWRGYGSLFSPELGAARASKNADRANDEYTQRDLFLRLRSRPIDRLYLSMRYRYRERDYDVGVATASNFAREDQRDEWTLRADVTAARFATLNLECVWIDGESTRAAKSFTSSELSFGVTLRHRHPSARYPAK